MTTNKPEAAHLADARAEFEKWASTHFFLQEEDTIVDDSYEYISVDMQLAWEAWYASSAAPDVAQLVEALEEGLRAIGDHHAPGDCYATGPMTGDPFRDLVQCPACSFIAMCDDLLAAHHKQEVRHD